MPDPLDAILADARSLPDALELRKPDRIQFEIDTDRSGDREVEARFQLGELGQRAQSPLSAFYRNRQFQYGLTDRILDPVEESQSLPVPRIISRFLMKPTSFSSIGPNRWEYAGYRVLPDPDDPSGYVEDTVPNPDDPPTVTIAHNTAEFDNDGSGPEGSGMDVSSATYVACNLSMLPVSGGVWPAVRWLLAGGELRVWFTAQNDHDKG